MADANERDSESRGTAWVVGQLILAVLALLAPRVGPRWPRPLRGPARLAGLALIGAGARLFTGGVADLGPNLTPFPRPKPGAALVREGSYRVVRHPIYGGFILAAFGWALLTTNTARLALAGGLCAFLDTKASREEVWLLERYPEYRAYRDDSGARKLLPGLY